MSDAFTDGRRFRVLAVVDDFSRECLGQVADTSLSGLRVTRELDALMAVRGKPSTIVSDNGTELTSMAVLKWCQRCGVEWHYIAPGKPMQNGFGESFMYGRPLRCKAIVRLGQGAGQVRSCMRPVPAAYLMTAGPDGIRGSMPHQRDALWLRLKLCGLYSIRGPPGRAITSLSPSQLSMPLFLSRCDHRRAEAFPARHQRPCDAGHLVGERDDHDLGRAAQAIGRSRGGWTTKVHALTDVIGRPYALMLTPGNVRDMKAAPELLERAGPMRYLLGDNGYDADCLRRLALIESQP